MTSIGKTFGLNRPSALESNRIGSGKNLQKKPFASHVAGPKERKLDPTALRFLEKIASKCKELSSDEERLKLAFGALIDNKELTSGTVREALEGNEKSALDQLSSALGEDSEDGKKLLRFLRESAQ